MIFLDLKQNNETFSNESFKYPALDSIKKHEHTLELIYQMRAGIS